jgi:hypothetical protein
LNNFLQLAVAEVPQDKSLHHLQIYHPGSSYISFY